MHHFVADESVQHRIIKLLREHGYSVYSISESNASVTDNEVLKIANSFECPLITEDKDFGELTFRLGMQNHGILLLRLSDVIPEKRGELVLKMLEDHLFRIKGCFSVLTRDKIRITKLDQ